MPGQDKIIFNRSQVWDMVGDLGKRLAAAHPAEDPPALVGIRSGGADLALRLRAVMADIYGQAPELGLMDITLYRDDWTRLHHRPKVGKTEIDFPITDRPVILVDDVLYTGRTVRAALDALIDLGRPRRIELAVLVDRGHRELPIQPDFVGAVVKTAVDEAVDVLLGPEADAGDQVILRRRAD